MKPWDVVAVFTEERLTVLAQMVVAIRNEALESHEPELGDGRWCLGCRAYERTIRRLAAAARSKAFPWLSVKVTQLYISLKIGGVPLRIYRGEAKKPHTNCVRSGLRDLADYPALPGMEQHVDDSKWFWLMAVETDSDGRPTNVVVQQANESYQTRWQWIVPVDLNALPAKEAAITQPTPKVTPFLPEAVDLGKPVVGQKLDKTSKEDAV